MASANYILGATATLNKCTEAITEGKATIRVVRPAITLLLATLPVVVFANGAMGLGLEMFDIGFWLAYVAVTIFFEAWFIGRWAGIPWSRSLGISVLANSITGICCPQLAAVGLHTPFVGSNLNPNPFWNAVVLFTGFGVISSVIEFVVWGLFVKNKSFMVRSLTGHLIGVPISLAILLLPSHPYRGLELMTTYQRRLAMERWAKRDLMSKIQEAEKIPDFESVEAAINSTRTDDFERDFWASAYVPSYERFSTGEGRQLPLEWNRSLNGVRLDGEEEKWIWLIRPPDRLKPSRWIEVDMSSGSVRGRYIAP